MDQPSAKVIANRFEIYGIAGAGGMGTVFRARDRHTGRWVALKLFHRRDGASSESDRLLQEAHILAELRHPGIVSHIAHGFLDAPILRWAEGQPFLVMEWLEGESLDTRLGGMPLSISESLLLLLRVSEALAIAHQHGIVHRDFRN